VTDVQELVGEVRSSDKDVQGRVFQALMAMTETPVDWGYDVWDELVTDLAHGDNRVRAIAAQVLCNLAKSDPEQRIIAALPELMVVTADERFVTARHCLQSLWKIGVTGPLPRETYRQALAARFAAAREEKNGTLVRSDIVESLGRVHAATDDMAIAHTAHELIASEEDVKYRGKYAKVWRARARR